MSYDMIDRFLRNNLGDDDYEEYLEALDSLCQPPQPAQEIVAWHEIVLNQKQFLEKMESLLVKTAAPPQRPRVLFPTMLRKMWSGGEVQQWLDENVNKENT